MPAAAVKRRVQALLGFTGRKGSVGGTVSRVLNFGAQPRLALDTAVLECERGEWNSRCSGGMRRYREERQWRRQLSSSLLTLRDESVGSEQD